MARLILVVIFCVSLPLLMLIYGSSQIDVNAAGAGQEIADKAKALAWPEKDKSKSTSPTTAFSEAAKAVGLSADNDCLRFVQVVILSSGVDPSFPKGEYSHNGGVDEYSTVKYMNDSSKWKKIGTTNVESLQAGDILVSAVNGVGNNHIFIYLGDGKAASANQGKWYGRIENLSEEWDPNVNSDKAFYYGDNKYQVFRINSSNTTNTNGTTTNSNTSNSSTSSSKTGQEKGLSEAELNKFAQNNILFYDPGDCIPSGGGSGTICGSTAREKYWSALGKYTDDPIKKAGIMGSIWQEGQYSPTSWQCGNGMDSSGNFIVPWDTMFDPSYSNPNYIGVGGFGITSGLSTYLHWINDNTPTSLQYLKEPTKYAYNYCRCDGDYCGYMGSEIKPGDQTMKAIGEAAFDELIEHEVEYAMTKFKNATTDEYLNTNFSSPSEAASWWARWWEVGQDYLNPDENRLQEAEKVYDDLKDFTCTASSSSSSSFSSSSSVPGSDITWIGDSDSALAHDEKGYELVQRTFPGIDYGSSFNEDGSYIQSGKFISQNVGGNKSGLDILKEIIQENKLRPYLVFALGGNGGWTDPEMKEFLNLIDGKDVKVIITTTKYRTVDFVEGNEIARKTAEEHPNIYLADVADNYKDEYIDDTGIEFNAEGGKMFVQTIKETLEKASGGGCTTYEGEYPQYNQCGDSRWSGIKYSTKSDGTPDDICGSGCGAASMAMLATVATGQDIFPNDIADLLGTQYYDKVSIHTLDPIVGEHYGFEVINESASSVEEAKTKLRDYLKKGYMIHFTGQGCYPGFIYASGGCTLGHVIGLFDIDNNDMVTQANSGMGEVHQKASLDDMAHAMMESWGIFTAIKGKNSGKNTCNTVDNVCGDSKTSNISTNASNLTEEQSQKLADYYNSTDGTYNCTTFVMWFIQNFTDLEYGGGNGGDVAHNLAVANNLEEGNEPRPLSVFSVNSIGSTVCEDGNLCGHTGIIASVDGDTLSTVEAAWQSYGGTVFTNLDKSSFSNSKYGKSYVYLDGHIDMDKLRKVIGS